MQTRVIPLDRLGWVPGGHPLERKRGPDGNVVLLEFDVGFEDPAFCKRSHVIYVVEGQLEVELEDRVLTAEKGQVIVVAAGDAHKAKNPGDRPAVLLVVSDV